MAEGKNIPPKKEICMNDGINSHLHPSDFCTNTISFHFLISLILNIYLQILFNLKLMLSLSVVVSLKLLQFLFSGRVFLL